MVQMHLYQNFGSDQECTSELSLKAHKLIHVTLLAKADIADSS